MKDTPWLIGLMILIGALANRSASYIYREVREGGSARLGLQFCRAPARQFLLFYAIAGLPVGFLNGLLLRLSWLDLLIVGVGTWVSMLVLITVLGGFRSVMSAALQFFLFAGISIAWLLTDAGAVLARHNWI